MPCHFIQTECHYKTGQYLDRMPLQDRTIFGQNATTRQDNIWTECHYKTGQYLDRMPLQDRAIFAPENKAYISFFGSGIEKIHTYQNDGGSNTYCSRTGVEGRIRKEVTHVSCDNLIIFKCTILERHYDKKFLLVKKEYFNRVDYILRSG